MYCEYNHWEVRIVAGLGAGLGGLLVFLNKKPAKDASINSTNTSPAQAQRVIQTESPVKAEEDMPAHSTFLNPATNLQTTIYVPQPEYTNLRGDVISENYVPASGNGESFYSFNLRTPQGFKIVQVYDAFADYGEHGRVFIPKEVLPTRTVGIGRIKQGQYVTGTVSNVLNAIATNSDVIKAPVTRIRFE